MKRRPHGKNNNRHPAIHPVRPPLYRYGRFRESLAPHRDRRTHLPSRCHWPIGDSLFGANRKRKTLFRKRLWAPPRARLFRRIGDLLLLLRHQRHDLGRRKNIRTTLRIFPLFPFAPISQNQTIQRPHSAPHRHDLRYGYRTSSVELPNLQYLRPIGPGLLLLLRLRLYLYRKTERTRRAQWGRNCFLLPNVQHPLWRRPYDV